MIHLPEEPAAKLFKKKIFTSLFIKSAEMKKKNPLSKTKQNHANPITSDHLLTKGCLPVQTNKTTKGTQICHNDKYF